jgi:subtilase family serine protease
MVLVLLFQESFTAGAASQTPIAPTPALTTIGGWTTLAGSLPAHLSAATRLARVAETHRVAVTISLRIHDAAGLDRTIADLYDPASPTYHQFLSVGDFATQFGAAPSVQAQVRSWLTKQGLTVQGTSRNALAIHAIGPASAITRAFETPLYAYKEGSSTFIANAQAVRLPRAVAVDVVSVAGLSTAHAAHPEAPFPTSTTTAGGPQGYSPSDYAKIYNYASLQASGLDGTGQTIAIAAFADYQESDVAVFDSQFGLSSNVTRIPIADGVNVGAQADEAADMPEAEADIEALQGVAPKATVLVYESPNTDSGAINMFNKIVSDNTAGVITNSWGSDEYDTPQSDIQAEHQTLQEAAAQGQSIFAASGDNGAYDAAGVSTTAGSNLIVDYPASDPFATGVGGTQLQTNGDTYATETAWSDTGYKPPAGGGGGLSATFKRPVWQTGPGVQSQYSNGMRQVPDVSFDADLEKGLSVYFHLPNGSSWQMFNGSSQAAPFWAGFITLVEQSLGHRLGDMNYTLYALGSGTYPAAPYHDVTQGTNLYFPAAPGWDFATGWGSFDGAAFLTDVKTVPTPTPTPTPTNTPTPTPRPTAIPPTISLTKVLLLHAVNGKQQETTSLKVGETGTVVVLYSASHAGSHHASGTIAAKQNGKTVATVKLKRSTYKGHAALTGSLRVSGKRSSTLNLHISLTLGPATIATTRSFTLVRTP